MILNIKAQRKNRRACKVYLSFSFATPRLYEKRFPNSEKQKTGVPKRLELREKYVQIKEVNLFK